MPNDVSRRKNRLNQVQIKSRYDKYVSSEEKRTNRVKRNNEIIQKNKQEIIDNGEYIDHRWLDVVEQVKIRDNNQCRLIKILSIQEYNDLKNNSNRFYKQLGTAHIFGKSSYPQYKYDIDNLIFLNWYSHFNLDNFKSPINGTIIFKEEHENWWRRIAEKQYEIMGEKIRSSK